MTDKDAIVNLLPPKSDPEAETLRKLVEDCIAGKGQEQRRFFERFAPGIFNVIKRYVYDTGTAQELLNDSFVKIFMRLRQYSWQGPIEAWMRRIAINTITDHLRRYLKEVKAGKIDFEDIRVDAYVDNEAVSNLSFKELMKYVHKLSPMQRMIFNLHVFESLTHGEISTLLSISEGNSRWILNDARKTLKQQILKRKK